MKLEVGLVGQMHEAAEILIAQRMTQFKAAEIGEGIAQAGELAAGERIGEVEVEAPIDVIFTLSP